MAYLESLNQYRTVTRKLLKLQESPLISYAGLHLLLCRYGASLESVEKRQRLSEILRGNLEELQREAEALLRVNESLALAVQGWGLDNILTENLPALPGQAALDQWARENTLGVMDEFPVKITSLMETILASAVALKEEWWGEFRQQDETLIGSQENCILGVVNTEAAGMVAVASPRGKHRFEVISLIAAPAVEPEAVWAALDEIVAMGRVATLPFVQVEESGHAWELSRIWREKYGQLPDVEASVSLPAWNETVGHELTQAPGVDLFLAGAKGKCVQQVRGEYRRDGFTAAAVTVVFRAASMAMSKNAKWIDRIDYNFLRPHALTVVHHTDEGPLRLFDAWVGNDLDIGGLTEGE